MLICRESIPFASIKGISPLNPRANDQSDVSSLAAMIKARGLLYELIVIPVAPEEYHVIAGGRRWRALQLDAPHLIGVDVAHDASEAELRELALIENVGRKQLHPVDEYEHFSALEEAGMEIPTIAQDFGITVRQVKQRLALGRLAPEIRAAWRAEKISADVAQAFTAGETHEAQRAVLAYLTDNSDDCDEYEFDALDVKRRLTADRIAPSEAEAIYVGEEAYRAAGGRVAESLFEEETRWLDGTLCTRLAREKMMREGEAIAAEEGWGFVWLDGDEPKHTLIEPDYIEEEKQRLHQALDIEQSTLLDEQRDAAPERLKEIDAALLALETEGHEIEKRAVLRAIAQAERASYGIIVEIDENGRLLVTRGVKPHADTAQDNAEDSPRASQRGEGPDGASAASRTAGAEAAGGSPSPPAAEGASAADVSSDAARNSGGVGKAARAVLDEAMTRGFRSIIARRPDAAILVALARDHIPLGGEYQHDLLQRLTGKTVHERLQIASAAAHSDCIVAFAELTAARIDTKGFPLSDFADLAAGLAARGGNLRAGFLSHFDYDAYFAAATKEAALACIRGCDGETAASEAGKLKKKELASRAANSAKDSSWLPEPLAIWAGLPPSPEGRVAAERPGGDKDDRSTAEAMADAIAADESGENKARDQVAQFIEIACDREQGATVKSDLLFQRFNRYAPAQGWDKLSRNAFGAAIAANAIEKKRFETGVHYLGLAVKEPALRQAAE